MNPPSLTLATCQSLTSAAFPVTSDRRISDVVFYLAHVEAGVSMRAIARSTGRCASTVLRAVRRVETSRDDILFDNVLADLGEAAAFGALCQSLFSDPDEGACPMNSPTTLTRSELTALARLCEPESFLLVAKGAEKAGVFCRKNQFRRPLSLVALKAATAMLTQDWVKCISKTDLSAKYVITAAGRASIKRLEAGSSTAEDGFGEAPNVFAAQHRIAGERLVTNPATGKAEAIPVNQGESPLGWLARRKDSKGVPLLQPEEVEAGERLREDFELAQIGPKVGQDWRRFLAPISASNGPGRTPSEGPSFARERVRLALDALGPGLSDAAFRICCFQEGLEATERRMGWSARSGKVVLKLALQRLVEHYGLKSTDQRAA
jgi:hypothetical protein